MPTAGLGWSRSGCTPGERILRELDARFDCRLLNDGPYCFPDLADVSEADEQTAIDAGLIRAARIDDVGVQREATKPAVRAVTGEMLARWGGVLDRLDRT